MSNTNFFDALFKSDTDIFIDTLNMLMLVDIGIIESVDQYGRATVLTSKIGAGQPYRMTNVEVIFPGNRYGAFTVDGGGCCCLIFAPRTIVPDVREMKISTSLPTFSKGGIKVMPISNGRNLAIDACFTAEGTLCINSEGYQLAFDPEGMSMISQAGMNVEVTKDNKINLYRRNKSSGILRIQVTDEGIHKEFINTNAGVKYTFDLEDESGKCVVEVLQPQAQGNPKSLLKLTLNGDGTFSINTLSFSFDDNGNVTMSTQKDVNLSCSKFNVNNGDLTVE